jgi:hypothetical protein
MVLARVRSSAAPGQLVDQCGGGGVADAAALLTGGDARADQQVGLAGARVAEQDQGLAVVDPGARRQRGKGGRVDAGRGAQVEAVQALDPGELGLLDAPVAAAGVALVGLGAQQLGEVGAVGEPVAGGGVGQLAGLGAHGGQVQGVAGGADGGLGGWLGQRANGGHGRAPSWVTVARPWSSRAS